MPVEKFIDDDEDLEDEAAGPPADEGVPNTRAPRGLLQRLAFPAGAGFTLGTLILAYFLLTRFGVGVNAGSFGVDSTLVPLESQMVNLVEPGSSLEIQIVFEASSPEFGGVLRRRTAQLADIALGVISAKAVGDLDSETERNRLKRELADAIGQRLRSDQAQITNVYFTRFYYRSN